MWNQNSKRWEWDRPWTVSKTIYHHDRLYQKHLEPWINCFNLLIIMRIQQVTWINFESPAGIPNSFYTYKCNQVKPIWICVILSDTNLLLVLSQNLTGSYWVPTLESSLTWLTSFSSEWNTGFLWSFSIFSSVNLSPGPSHLLFSLLLSFSKSSLAALS